MRRVVLLHTHVMHIYTYLGGYLNIWSFHATTWFLYNQKLNKQIIQPSVYDAVYDEVSQAGYNTTGAC